MSKDVPQATSVTRRRDCDCLALSVRRCPECHAAHIAEEAEDIRKKREMAARLQRNGDIAVA